MNLSSRLCLSPWQSLVTSHASLYLYLSGMFANAEGISQRAPVSWSESVIAATVCFPYVVALDEGFVTVHSMLDQQLKQTLSFRDGHLLQDFEGKSTVPYIYHLFHPYTVLIVGTGHI